MDVRNANNQRMKLDWIAIGFLPDTNPYGLVTLGCKYGEHMATAGSLTVRFSSPCRYATFPPKRG